jgi:hypothetical protein
MPDGVHCKEKGRMIHTKVYHPIANQHGLYAALVFGVIEYWVQANTRKRNVKAAKNGQYCVYLSGRQWTQELPFISEREIWRALKLLKDKKLIACFEGDLDSRRANYYAINQEEMIRLNIYAGGGVLRPSDGIAMTPEDQRLPEVDPCQSVSIEEAGVCQSVSMSMPISQYVHANQSVSSLYLDKESKQRVTESKVADVVGTASRRPPKKAKDKPAGSVVWDAYRSAYLQRYNCEPIRNAAINSICKRLHEAVGDEAVVLVQHYVSMNKRFYLEKSHPLSTCLADIQAIKTAYTTGKTMTYQQVKELENRQTAKETADEVQQSDGELASAWARIDTKRTIKI